MVIFPKINAVKLMQINDGIRLDARKTIYRNIQEITDVLISPEGASGSESFISVFDSGNFDNWFLDWQYDSAGEKRVVARVITDSDEFETELTIEVITPEEDNLFSTDQDIIQSEPDILRYLPGGRSSFIFMHREAQERILAFLDENRIWKKGNERYTKEDISDIEEFRHWSRFLALHLIYSAKVVSPDDFFASKAIQYENLMARARSRATLRLEPSGDGNVELIDRVSTIQVRR